jgi:hypothetical protein
MALLQWNLWIKTLGTCHSVPCIDLAVPFLEVQGYIVWAVNLIHLDITTWTLISDLVDFTPYLGGGGGGSPKLSKK